MNSKDYRNLQEAYLDVYEQEESLDEGYKDLPRLRMAGQAFKKTRRGFEGARTAINSGETKDTIGGQIASKKSMKDVTQAQKIINKSLPGGHSKEKTQTKEKFNKSVGEFAKKDPELAASIRKRMVNKESYDLYDIILSHLIDEGYADTEEAAERIMVNMSEEWKETILEITGGKGHPGYKAGSRDLGPMQSGHPADSSKRTMKGGTMSMRHGDHLGDLDDDDDDDDDDGLEAGLKDSARKSRENVRKPLRNMVKTAAKRLNK